MIAPDRFAQLAISRSALLAVELFDPVALALVSGGGATLSATGLIGQPITSFSGRFVWLAEQQASPDLDRWPTSFNFVPGGLPFEQTHFAAEPKPAPGENRIFRYALTPSAAYPFQPYEGVTVLRGTLRTGAGDTDPPLAGAKIWLRWRDLAAKQPADRDGEIQGAANEKGDFAVFLRLPQAADPERDAANQLNVRLVVSYDGREIEKPFPLAEGALCDLPKPLAWSELIKP